MTKKLRGDVIILDRDWWKKERSPSEQRSLVIKRPVLKSKQPLLRPKDIAARLNIGVWSVYDYINSGELDSQVIGNRKRVSEEALEDFLTRQNQKKGKTG